MDGLDRPTRRLFLHLIVSYMENLWDEGWTPISSCLIDRDLRGASWKRLHAIRYAGEPLIEYTNYSRSEGLSREFRVCEAFMDDYLATLPCTVEEAATEQRYDLFTGMPTTGRAKTLLKDENNNPHGVPGSPLYRALRILKNAWVYYHRADVESLLEARKRLQEQAYEAFEVSGQDAYSEAYRAYLDAYDEAFHGRRVDYCRAFKGVRYSESYRTFLTAKHQYLNDRFAYQAVLGQYPEPAPEIGPDIWKFRAAYSVQMSGRVGCVGGMFQSCSREMKHAAFASVPNVRNYDLRGSQPNGLIQRFEEAIEDGAVGVDASWLRAYTSDRDGKHKMAAQTGITVDTWKSCLCMVMMGATVPKSPLRSTGDLVKTLREDVGEDALAVTFDRVEALLRDLTGPRDAWHEYLVTAYVDHFGYNTRGGRVVRNEAGAVFCPGSVRLMHERKARLAAFLLQGLEAAFIHMLTVLSAKYEYTVLQNEHDGLIVMGVIPEDAVREAADAVGMRYATLVEKPYCDEPLTDQCQIVEINASRKRHAVSSPMLTSRGENRDTGVRRHTCMLAGTPTISFTNPAIDWVALRDRAAVQHHAPGAHTETTIRRT